MAIQTTAPSRTDGDQQARTTGGLLIATAVVALPQLALAVFIALSTWVELSEMTPAQRAESWAELGYLFAAVIAVPPVLAAALSGGAWSTRRRALGQGLAIAGLCVAGIPAALWLSSFTPFGL